MNSRKPSHLLNRERRPGPTPWTSFCRRLLPALLLWHLAHLEAPAQGRFSRTPSLEEAYFRAGHLTLDAFQPVVQAARGSIVRLDLDGTAVALGAIISSNGLVLTKASEIKSGTLTGRLADGREVAAALVSSDEANDVGLVKLEATGLPPIEWASDEAVVGQWAVTPGIGETPEAVGIVSVPPRKILPRRAFIGVQLDLGKSEATVAMLMPGLGAEKAGLQPGDTVLAVNETAVRTREELVDTLRQFREGQIVKLKIRRGSEEMEVSVEMMVPQPEGDGRGPDRAERMNMMGGELSGRAEGFAQALQHDSVLQPRQCGGPLVNLEGKALGLNIARAGRVASYALPARLLAGLIYTLKAQAEAKANGP